MPALVRRISKETGVASVDQRREETMRVMMLVRRDKLHFLRKVLKFLTPGGLAWNRHPPNIRPIGWDVDGCRRTHSQSSTLGSGPLSEAAARVRSKRALGLKPWEPSPLPRDIEPLGVDEGPGPQNRTSWAEAWPKVQELQRALIEATGGRPRASRQRSD
jgi:hypothetical protein